jgi:type III secretion protein Q
VLLGCRPGLIEELDALRVAAAGALSAVLGSDVQITAAMADAPAAASGALGRPALFSILSLGGPGTEAVLELDPRLVSALAARRTGSSGPDVPVLAATRFERALLAELLLRILAALRELTTAEARWRPRLLEVSAGRAEAERRLGSGMSVVVELGLEGCGLRGRGALHVPELALRVVALSVPVARGLPGPHSALARVFFSPRVACGSLWPHELAALVPGAALVLPGASVVDRAVHTPVALVHPGVSLAGMLSAEGYRHTACERRPTCQEVTHVDPALSELPVDVEVELARVPLSLAELGALEPGVVLPLRVSAGDPVFLRAGDRRIARAELVEVEGEVAARVLELVP